MERKKGKWMTDSNGSGQHIRWATVLGLACLLLVLAEVPATPDGGPVSAVPAALRRLYLPVLRRTVRVFLPLAFSNGPTVSLPQERPATSAAAPVARGAVAPGTDTPGFVKSQGEDLQLDGQPYVFVGVNARYLAGPYFPEDRVEGIIAFLASQGVSVMRVWPEPPCDLDRVERLLDLGRRYDMRFVLTLQDFYGQESGQWFREYYPYRDLPHIRGIVSRFADRPEVLMWELMNEPTCPSKDSGQDCWDALYQWAAETSQEIKRLDSNHLVSVGTQRAGFCAGGFPAFLRVHALDTIDVVSLHCEVGKIAQGELDGEIAIAHELGKPVYLGEAALQGHNESCQPLGGVLERRARAVDADIEDTRGRGIDGYLLWEYNYGGVGTGNDITYYCSIWGYFENDPVWEVIKAAAQ
jgi:mannan endo-1,4-beta-mannosidase